MATNGGTQEKRIKFLKRLVTEIKEVCPLPFCLSVKLNSGDYMVEGGLTTDEALEQVKVAARVWDGGLRGDIGWNCRAVYFQVA